VALDKDKESVNLMNAFKNTFPLRYDWLFPQVWNIAEGWGTVCKEHSVETFDLALLFKLVPVVKRTSPVLLQQLVDIPAETIVISGVKESMVKRHDIERKERKAIDNFIKDTGRSKTGEFELGNEFFIIIR
jgi:16S rRNA (guanine(1405)-N(7))-methyltransferase